jgi:uncharacterized protein
VKATPDNQRRLLDLAEIDVRVRRAASAKANPPHAARVKELLAQRIQQSQEAARLAGVRDDLKVELRRIESDVAVVDARAERDAARLAVSANAKEAQGLESEISSLAKRKSDLEDAELVVMERLETAEEELSAQEALVAETNAEGARLSAEGKEAVARATRDGEEATRDRATVAGDIDAALVAMYDRLSERGNGAGLLRGGTCGACRMVLSGTDLAAVRQAGADDVLTCPECGAILVRTEESGL